MALKKNEELLVSQLKRGDKKEIAKKLGLHVNTVSSVVRGIWYNENVWFEVVRIVKDRQVLENEKRRLANSIEV